MTESSIQSLWTHIHALAVLSKMGSFTATAHRLGISKAAMSQRIAELERAAGVPLVRRTTRSVNLTEAGQMLVDRTGKAFEVIEAGFAQIRDSGSGPRGLLRVTAPVALGRQRIVPLLPAFLREYPDLRVELDLSDRLASLSLEAFDLAIRHTNSAPETHVAWTLCKSNSLLVASRSYLERHGAPEHPHALADHNCLYYLRLNEPPAWSFEPVNVRGKVARLSVPVRGSFSANNSEAMREAAIAGLGIALLPDFSAQTDIDDGRLIPVLTAWRPSGAFGDKILAIRPFSLVVPAAARVLAEYLKANLSQGFSSGAQNASVKGARDRAAR